MLKTLFAIIKVRIASNVGPIIANKRKTQVG
jgi:hypothetical protein